MRRAAQIVGIVYVRQQGGYEFPRRRDCVSYGIAQGRVALDTEITGQREIGERGGGTAGKLRHHLEREIVRVVDDDDPLIGLDVARDKGNIVVFHDGFCAERIHIQRSGPGIRYIGLEAQT